MYGMENATSIQWQRLLLLICLYFLIHSPFDQVIAYLLVSSPSSLCSSSSKFLPLSLSLSFLSLSHWPDSKLPLHLRPGSRGYPYNYPIQLQLPSTQPRTCGLSSLRLTHAAPDHRLDFSDTKGLAYLPVGQRSGCTRPICISIIQPIISSSIVRKEE